MSEHDSASKYLLINEYFLDGAIDFTGTLKSKIDAKAVVPPVRAGTFRLKQLSEQDAIGNSKVCEDLSFNPWNGNIENHKPLGVVSRMKRRVYNASRKMRHLLNGFAEESFERQK